MDLIALYKALERNESPQSPIQADLLWPGSQSQDEAASSQQSAADTKQKKKAEIIWTTWQ